MNSTVRFIRKVLLPLGIAVVVGSLLSMSVGRELASDCELYGAATVRNQPAAVGSVIEAYIDGNLMADTTVRIRGRYQIAIPADDPVTIDHDGWLQQDNITLVIGGETAQPTISALDGRREVDISVQYISDVRRTTWGKIKALFR